MCAGACKCVQVHSGGRQQDAGHTEERSCTPLQPTLARKSRDDASLLLPWPGPRLPPLPCWVPAALTDRPPGLGCGASPEPGGRTVLASSAACCVMNKCLGTHQLECRPCVPTASEGRERRGQGPAPQFPPPISPPGWAARRLSRGTTWGQGSPGTLRRAGPHLVSKARQRLQIEMCCLEQQRRASQRRSLPEPL